MVFSHGILQLRPCFPSSFCPHHSPHTSSKASNFPCSLICFTNRGAPQNDQKICGVGREILRFEIFWGECRFGCPLSFWRHVGSLVSGKSGVQRRVVLTHTCSICLKESQHYLPKAQWAVNPTSWKWTWTFQASSKDLAHLTSLPLASATLFKGLAHHWIGIHLVRRGQSRDSGPPRYENGSKAKAPKTKANHINLHHNYSNSKQRVLLNHPKDTAMTWICAPKAFEFLSHGQILESAPWRSTRAVLSTTSDTEILQGFWVLLWVAFFTHTKHTHTYIYRGFTYPILYYMYIYIYIYIHFCAILQLLLLHLVRGDLFWLWQSKQPGSGHRNQTVERFVPFHQLFRPILEPYPLETIGNEPLHCTWVGKTIFAKNLICSLQPPSTSTWNMWKVWKSHQLQEPKTEPLRGISGDLGAFQTPSHTAKSLGHTKQCINQATNNKAERFVTVNYAYYGAACVHA